MIHYLRASKAHLLETVGLHAAVSKSSYFGLARNDAGLIVYSFSSTTGRGVFSVMPAQGEDQPWGHVMVMAADVYGLATKLATDNFLGSDVELVVIQDKEAKRVVGEVALAHASSVPNIAVPADEVRALSIKRFATNTMREYSILSGAYIFERGKADEGVTLYAELRATLVLHTGPVLERLAATITRTCAMLPGNAHEVRVLNSAVRASAIVTAQTIGRWPQHILKV